MRVLFISANTEAINMITIPVGLGAVATATQRAGNEVELLDLMNEKKPDKAARDCIEKFNPGIIGISVRNIDDQVMNNPRFLLNQAKAVIAACRENSGAPIVLGGAGYSIFPHKALLYLGADMGIQGEGEIAFPVLVDRIERGEDPAGTPGLCLPDRGPAGERIYKPNMDEMPVPDEKLWTSYSNSARDVWMPFQTRRGCPMDCSYCSTSRIEGRLIRKRSPGAVIEAIARYADAGFRQFYFTDNTFNFPSSYAREICRRIVDAKLKISWRCILYPKNIDEDLVRDMAEAGCKDVSLGFESGCDSILKKLNKKFGTGEVRRISEILADYGIGRIGFLLLGGPGETKESVEQSLDFADSLNLEAMRITSGIRIYPGTSLADIARREGFIDTEDDLLHPKFYLAGGLEGWLYETARKRVSEHPNWLM